MSTGPASRTRRQSALRSRRSVCKGVSTTTASFATGDPRLLPMACIFDVTVRSKECDFCHLVARVTLGVVHMCSGLMRPSCDASKR